MRLWALVAFSFAACVIEQPVIQAPSNTPVAEPNVEPVAQVVEIPPQPAWHGVIVLKGNRKLGFFLTTYDSVTKEHVINPDQMVIEVLGETKRGLRVFKVPASFGSVLQHISVTKRGVVRGYAKVDTCEFVVESQAIPWEPENGELEGSLYILGDNGVGPDSVLSHCPNYLPKASKVIKAKKP